MKNRDNNFKKDLLKELTGFSYKDKARDTVVKDNDVDDDDSFEFIPAASNFSEASSETTSVEEPRFNEGVGVGVNNFTYTPSQTRTVTENLATTTVSRATIINGGVQTRENVVVEGIVNGDIVSKGKVTVKGKVDGNITGYDVDISCEELTGNVICESKAIVHASTKLNGDLFAARATIVGTIEGNVHVKESIELLDNAIVYGDIKAASITVSEGAVIYGMVTIGKAKPDTPKF